MRKPFGDKDFLPQEENKCEMKVKIVYGRIIYSDDLLTICFTVSDEVL